MFKVQSKTLLLVLLYIQYILKILQNERIPVPVDDSRVLRIFAFSREDRMDRNEERSKIQRFAIRIARKLIGML